jgi:hypothetical protein
MKKLLTTLIVFSLASVCSAGWWGGTSLNSSTDANVRDINVGGSLRGKLGDVVVLNTNGIRTAFTATADTNVARAAAYNLARAVVTKGGLIQCGPGDYDFGNSGKTYFEPNVTTRGVYGSTHFKNSYTSPAGSNVFVVCNGSYVQDLIIDMNLFGGATYQYGIGPNSTGDTYYLDHVTVLGDSDGLCIQATESNTIGYITNSIFRTHFDTIVLFTGGTGNVLYISDCNIFNSYAGDGWGNITQHGISGRVLLHINNSSITVENTRSSGTIACTGISAVDGNSTIQNCIFSTTSTIAGTLYDIKTFTQDARVAFCTGSGPGGSLLTNGAITYTDKLPILTSFGLPTLVQGDILYISGANTITILPKSTDVNSVLTNNGTNNNPIWQTEPNLQANRLYIEQFLSYSDVNFHDTNALLYTVPAGKTLIITKVIFLNITGGTPGASYTISDTSNLIIWKKTIDLSTFTTTDAFYASAASGVSATGINKVFPAGTAIYFCPITASVTYMVGKVLLYGVFY